MSTDTIHTTKLDPNKTWFPNSLLKSKVWLSLGGKAPQVFMIFMSKRNTTKQGERKKQQKEYSAWNHKELEFTYSEAAKMGIGEHAFRRAIDNLVDHGFIDIEEYGGGVEQRKTIYRLSNRWKKWGTDEFHMFARIKHNRGFCSDEKRFKHPPKEKSKQDVGW
jgi:hypothetical protein